jgi:hypothetical protein
MRAATRARGLPLCAGARPFDGYAPTHPSLSLSLSFSLSLSLSLFHSRLGTCLEPRSTDRTLYTESRRLRPIQMQLNSQFRPLRVSGKDYGRGESCALPGRACRICIHARRKEEREREREREREGERGIADVCINAYTRLLRTLHRAYSRRTWPVRRELRAAGMKALAIKVSATRAVERRLGGSLIAL